MGLRAIFDIFRDRVCQLSVLLLEDMILAFPLGLYRLIDVNSDAILLNFRSMR